MEKSLPEIHRTPTRSPPLATTIDGSSGSDDPVEVLRRLEVEMSTEIPAACTRMALLKAEVVAMDAAMEQQRSGDKGVGGGIDADVLQQIELLRSMRLSDSS